jgi:hypothetical protein
MSLKMATLRFQSTISSILPPLAAICTAETHMLTQP